MKISQLISGIRANKYYHIHTQRQHADIVKYTKFKMSLTETNTKINFELSNYQNSKDISMVYYRILFLNVIYGNFRTFKSFPVAQ